MKNLVFLTGIIVDKVELAYEIDEKKFYKFTLETIVNDKPEQADCIATDKFYNVLMEGQMSGNAISISGTFRSKKYGDKGNDTYVYCKDVITALPFSDDENTVILEGVILGEVKVYASHSVAFLKTMIGKSKWAFVPLVAWENVGRRMAFLKRYDSISVRGHIHTDDGYKSEVVVDDFEMKGDRNNEIFESYGAELQRERAVRSQFEQRQGNGLRSKPHWKNDSYGRSLRHPYRQDVRRVSYRHGQVKGL